jgi:hypothetical protein
MKVLKTQIQRIHLLLPPGIKANKELKANIVHQYTKDWSKTSTKDLTLDQANQLIERFGGKPIQYENWASFDVKLTSPRTILSLAMQFGWQVYKADRGIYVADLYKLSEWLKSKKSPVNKPLMKMTPAEISKIIYALEKMNS